MSAAEGLLWLACLLVAGIVYGAQKASEVRRTIRGQVTHIDAADIEQWERELSTDK